MGLLTGGDRSALPALYSQEEKGAQALARLKFFTPDGAATWYATEFDGEDTFFGYADLGMGFPELGYFSLRELETTRGGLGLEVEKDRHYTPETLEAIKARHEGAVNRAYAEPSDGA